MGVYGGKRGAAYGRPVGFLGSLPYHIPLSTDQVLCSASSFLSCPAWGSGTPLVWVASSTAMFIDIDYLGK